MFYYQKAITQAMYEDTVQVLKQNTNPYILYFDIVYSVQNSLLLLIKYQQFERTNYVSEVYDLPSNMFRRSKASYIYIYIYINN
jgi:hypothetical protein